jgi:NCAIR mutase (PurE)-related protein
LERTVDKESTLELLQRVASGELSPEEGLGQLGRAPFEQTMAGVTIDTHRGLRTGLGEVVYGQGKSNEQLSASLAGLGRHGVPVLATRVSREQADFLAGVFPQGAYWPEARLYALDAARPLDEGWPSLPNRGELMVVTAGASDLPVALEAVGTARFLGLDVGLASDVGVAGLHRLLPHLEPLTSARLLLVVAGMEGALPSVLGGLCGRPLIAVPTSVGYGASFGGLAALLAMLNSCAPGVAVVNIDNGFGAAVMAHRLLTSL